MRISLLTVVVDEQLYCDSNMILKNMMNVYISACSTNCNWITNEDTGKHKLTVQHTTNTADVYRQSYVQRNHCRVYCADLSTLSSSSLFCKHDYIFVLVYYSGLLGWICISSMPMSSSGRNWEWMSTLWRIANSTQISVFTIQFDCDCVVSTQIETWFSVDGVGNRYLYYGLKKPVW